MVDRALIAPLHGLRGLAALTVLFGHFRSYTGVPDAKLATSIGVVLFFALSGFLMGHLYLVQRPTAAGVTSFVVSRFARIYPLFAFVVLLAAALSLISQTGVGPFGMTAGEVLRHLVLAGSGGTVWTISVEFQFYGLFLVLWVATGMSTQHRDTLVLCAAAASVIWALVFGYPEGRIDIMRYLHVFMIGLAGAVIWRRYPETVNKWAPLTLILSTGYFLASYVVIPRFYDQAIVYSDMALCLVCGGFVVAAAAAPRTFIGRVLSTKPAQFFGELSFGLYLLHRIVMFGMREVDYLGMSGVPLTVAFFGLTVLAAWLAYKCIEVPARFAIKSQVSRRGDARPVAAE